MVCGGVVWCGVVCVCPGRMERRCYGCRLELTSYYPHPYTCRHSFSLPPTQGHCWLYTGSAVWLSLWGCTPHSLLLAQALGRMTSKLCYSDACNTPNTQHPIPNTQYPVTRMLIWHTRYCWCCVHLFVLFCFDFTAFVLLYHRHLASCTCLVLLALMWLACFICDCRFMPEEIYIDLPN